jgi:hypothetical protein
MSLRIAVDLDGTLADMDAALQAEAERLFGPDVDLRATLRGRAEGAASAEAPDPTASSPGMRSPLAAPSRATRLADRQHRQLWARVRETENFWESLGEVEPGAVARLAHAAVANAWEVLFITTRPSSAGDTTQIQSQRWLQKHGFELPSVYVVSGSRGHIATALTLDAVLDDRPENCLDVATASNATPILVWRDTPDTVPPGARRLGIHVVFSIAEALQQLGTPGSRGGLQGIMHRVRWALGI